MTLFGIHASHEQLAPGELLRAVVLAERSGFGAAMSSDHFSPWSARQGESGFAWTWLGAAMQATSLPFGVVTAPGQRYHPAISAQAISTVATMFPGRFWAALGTGEASNEHITGAPWPAKPVRSARLRECVDVLRALFAGEEVTHHGLVTVDRARLWTLPAEPPALVGAAVSPRTAAWCAGWADGLITVNAPEERLRAVADAYRDAGGRGPLRLQVHLSYAADADEALRIAHEQWRSNVFPPPACWDIDHTDTFDAMSAHVPPAVVAETVNVSHEPGWHAERLANYAELGYEEIFLHHVGQHLDEFIEVFAGSVLPQLTEPTEPTGDTSRSVARARPAAVPA
ncbi:putative non-F420 flavinoid oxidoreductase [Frankia sp. EI5c]|uniref:TIGR03885 family FMN-dependent LLM class oxidoreductase n=1 Tax=Frankia sp. EI5c TaxID=683316 RepID=UPI0007C3F0CA|nr:TIGR03885 family FMN-dependent LLM class oxidoreductase [Frankia sp. EI5c]OAA27750.1 putative non-F420 flavinoid oxidoreductase [Frankia sp. EI5c]